MSVDLFGTKDDLDRIISIAKSAQIVTYIINKHKLFEHYEIDTTKEYFLSITISKFKKNYEVEKNEYGAIEIHVVDQEKIIAANIANDLVDRIDEVNKNMVLTNRLKLLKIFKKQLGNKREEVKLLTDSLTTMRKTYHVYNINSQSEILTNEITKSEALLRELKAQKGELNKRYSKDDPYVVRISARIIGLQKKLAGLRYGDQDNKFNLESFNKGSDKVIVLQAAHLAAIEELKIINKAYEQYSVATDPNMSSLYIMEKAHAAEKAVPIQLFAVVGTFFVMLFFSLMTAAIIEIYRKATS